MPDHLRRVLIRSVVFRAGGVPPMSFSMSFATTLASARIILARDIGSVDEVGRRSAERQIAELVDDDKIVAQHQALAATGGLFSLGEREARSAQTSSI